MISKKAKAVYKALEMINFKSQMNFDNPRRAKIRRIPLLLNFENEIEHFKIMDRDVYNLYPDDFRTKKHVMFFHGGGYANEASINHYVMISKFINMAHCVITFVEYPLVPESDVLQALDMALIAYKEQLSRFPEHQFTFMGDSAGGGLALALAMQVRDLEMRAPEKLILFSPWLDVTMTHPDIPQADARDLILNLESLHEVGLKYANGLPLEDYRVSPIYGDLSNLGEILVFYGSDEVFRPDCDKFANMDPIEGTSITAIEYEMMQHDWVVMPIPEQQQALREAVDFLNEA